MRRPARPRTDKARKLVRPFVEAGQSIPKNRLAKEHGLSAGTLSRAAMMEEARIEARLELSSFAPSTQKRLEAYRRRLEKEAEEIIQRRVKEEIKRGITEMVLPAFEEEKQDARLVLEARKGVFSREEYNKVLRCLHPDLTPSSQEKNEAFHLWHSRKIVLMKHEDYPKEYQRLPTVEEFVKGKKVTR